VTVGAVALDAYLQQSEPPPPLPYARRPPRLEQRLHWHVRRQHMRREWQANVVRGGRHAECSACTTLARDRETDSESSR
jgi:hypothetical protein